jgi:hypothetical protein
MRSKSVPAHEKGGGGVDASGAGISTKAANESARRPTGGPILPLGVPFSVPRWVEVGTVPLNEESRSLSAQSNAAIQRAARSDPARSGQSPIPREVIRIRFPHPRDPDTSPFVGRKHPATRCRDGSRPSDCSGAADPPGAASLFSRNPHAPSPRAPTARLALRGYRTAQESS